MTIVTVCLIILHTNHLYMDTSLFLGNFGQSGWASGALDLLWPIVLITNLATIAFIYKTDFSPIYYRTLNNESESIELTHEEIELDKLNRIAEMQLKAQNSRRSASRKYLV